MRHARHPIQFGLKELLAFTAAFGVCLGLVRHGLTNLSPVTAPVALALGLIGFGALAGTTVGYLKRGPAGAVWGAYVVIFLVVVVPFVLGVIILVAVLVAAPW